MSWRDQLDEILPEPGTDLAFLDDTDLVDALVRRAMGPAAARAHADSPTLRTVLDSLLTPTGT